MVFFKRLTLLGYVFFLPKHKRWLLARCALVVVLVAALPLVEGGAKDVRFPITDKLVKGGGGRGQGAQTSVSVT